MNIEEKQNNGKSKLLQGIVIGAIAGAAVLFLIAKLHKRSKIML